MNVNEEIKRIEFCINKLTRRDLVVEYRIGNICFEVEMEWSSRYNSDDDRYELDIDLIKGEWCVWDTDEFYDMNFGPDYKDWMLNILNEYWYEGWFNKYFDEQLNWEFYGI